MKKQNRIFIGQKNNIMKKNICLLMLLPLIWLTSCSSDDDSSSGEPLDFGESSLTLSGDYDLELNGTAIFDISEEEVQGRHQFRIDLNGTEEMRYNMNLIIRLQDMNYQSLEGSTFPLSNVSLSNNAEAFSTDLILYGESLTDVVAEWTSIEDDGEGVGSITITKADEDNVEGTIQATLTPKAGEATGPLICNANFTAVRNQ